MRGVLRHLTMAEPSTRLALVRIIKKLIDMKYTEAIDDLEYCITEYQNTIDNIYDGDFKISERDKDLARKAIPVLACAIEVLKNNED